VEHKRAGHLPGKSLTHRPFETREGAATRKSKIAQKGAPPAVLCDNNLRIDVAWRVIKRAGFLPERGTRVEIQMERGAVRRMRRASP
jgi:hypothetical protein